MAHLVYIGFGALAMYGYATGRFSDFFDKKLKNNNGESSISSSSSSSSQSMESQSKPPTIIVQSPLNNGRRNSYLIPFGCAAVFGLSGYYYYIHSSGTQKVIHRVEETAEETQTLVQQTDDNNAKRFEILDKKNEIRSQNLELEIRSEQKAGFSVIRDQLYCLQQVAIQTLSTVASLSSSNNKQDNNNNNNNEKLLAYCDKAQEMADTIISDEHILKTKENNLKEIKAEIQHRNNQYNIIMNKIDNDDDITPGGPSYNDNDNNNNNNNNNEFDINRNQSTITTNVSSSSYRDNDNELSIMNKLQNGIRPIEFGYYIWNNRQYVILGIGVVTVFTVTKKINDYILNNNDTKDIQQ